MITRRAFFTAAAAAAVPIALVPVAKADAMPSGFVSTWTDPQQARKLSVYYKGHPVRCAAIDTRTSELWIPSLEYGRVTYEIRKVDGAVLGPVAPSGAATWRLCKKCRRLTLVTPEYEREYGHYLYRSFCERHKPVKA